MQPGALRPYERSLMTAEPVAFYTSDGTVIDLDIDRWLAPADAADETVLERCVGPVLDVGCGPGRFVAALLQRDTAALGVDIAETAVAMTRRRGLPTLRRDVFSRLPGEGRWASVLLMDGNIGIGGNPRRLLSRIHQLLAPGGVVLLETDADERADQVLTVRFCRHGKPIGPPFDWARLGLRSLRQYVDELGYAETEMWTSGGRTFATLHR